MPRPDIVFIDQPLFRAEHFGSSVVVFRPTDLFEPGLMTRRAFDVAARAHAIVATSPGVLEAYAADARARGVVIENGVDFRKFNQESGASSEYDFVYVGALDRRLSFEGLAQAATRLPSATFALFGPIPQLSPTLPANIQLRGPVAYDDVPRVMARGRWGLMPFVDSPLNASRSPMKLYEYIAAGVPVVAPESTLRRVPELKAGIGFDSSRPGDLADKLASAYAVGPMEVPSTDMRLAAEKDWGKIARELLSIAESVPA